MATLVGWSIDHSKNIPADASADITIGQVLKLTAEDTAAVCGAGETPRGIAFYSRDISEDGARISMMTEGTAVLIVGSTAISDMNIPVTTGASGTVVPCSSNNDPVVGWPERTEATAGAYIPVKLALGTFYGA